MAIVDYSPNEYKSNKSETITKLLYLYNPPIFYTMPIQTEITVRVRGIFQELIKRKKVRGNRDFLGFTGIRDSLMSAVLNPDSTRPNNLPKKFEGMLIDHWKINPEYLYKGKGPMFAEEIDEPTLKEVNENLKAVLKELKKLNAR